MERRRHGLDRDDRSAKSDWADSVDFGNRFCDGGAGGVTGYRAGGSAHGGDWVGGVEDGGEGREGAGGGAFGEGEGEGAAGLGKLVSRFARGRFIPESEQRDFDEEHF